MDSPFLREMGLAAHGDPLSVSEDHLFKLYGRWGQAGDLGVIATGNRGSSIGAAWQRRFLDRDYFWLPGDTLAPEVIIAVNDDFRGRGVGKTLLAALMERSADAGVRELCLTVEKSNKIALGLYKSFGFQIISPLVFAGAVERPGYGMVAELDGLPGRG